MFWLLGVGVVAAIGVAALEFWSVRQVEERLRRKWRDNEKERKAEGVLRSGEEKESGRSN